MKFVKTLTVSLVLICQLTSAEPQITHLQKGDKHIGVFGTMHVAKPDFYPLPSTVTVSLKQADALIVELDITDPQVMREITQVSQEIILKNKILLGKERLEKLDEVLGEPRAKMFTRSPPWMLAFTIILERAYKAGFVQNGVDKTLIELAKKLKKPVISLENATKQFSLFTELSATEQLSLFDDAVSATAIEELEQMAKFWKNQDEKFAELLLNDMQRETPILFQTLYLKRNHMMARRIDTLSDKHQHLLVAIGALHLYGDASVIELLRQSGWQKTE